ncbi:MAG: universal stress protein [Tissierellia bacterium]|nr:universal stress protein [Tissierellia bacterium]
MLKLLVPIDGSSRSKQSLDWIKSEYKDPSNVEVIILIVREDMDFLRTDQQKDRAKKEVMPMLDEIAANLDGFKIRKEVLFGRAGEEILKYADENDIDTIVMTKSTRPGWVRIIGSVTTHVVKYTNHIVVIVPELASIHD